jgi:Ca-activated chloride channel family protein
VTEPKRPVRRSLGEGGSQKTKRPLSQFFSPNGYGIFSTALISISLFALVMQKVCAQSADDFFHTGARAYLTNNTTTAKEQVDKGLKLYPDDAKLKKLDELLKQQQQQQQQQNQKQQQQQQNQSQQNQSQSKQDQQKQQDQKKQDEQKKQDQQKPDQAKQDQKEQPKEQQTPGEMTPEEAKQLLDAQKGDEKMLPANQKDKHDREHPLKDW